MKKRTKIIGLAIAAICAFSAIAATAQAADQWYTGTTSPLTTLAVGSSKPVVGKSGTSRLTVPSLGLSVVCTADSFKGTITNVSTGGVVEAHIGVPAGVKFTGCSIKTHPAGGATVCTVKSTGQAAGTIVTAALTGKFNTTTGAGKAHVQLSPATGTTFTTIEIGGGCAFETGESTPVAGSVEGTQTSPALATEESHSTVYSFPETALSGSSLKLGTAAATFISTEEVELETAGEKAQIK